MLYLQCKPPLLGAQHVPCPVWTIFNETVLVLLVTENMWYYKACISEPATSDSDELQMVFMCTQATLHLYCERRADQENFGLSSKIGKRICEFLDRKQHLHLSASWSQTRCIERRMPPDLKLLHRDITDPRGSPKTFLICV